MKSNYIPRCIKFMCGDVISLVSLKSLILLFSISFQSAVKKFIPCHYIIDDKLSNRVLVRFSCACCEGIWGG